MDSSMLDMLTKTIRHAAYLGRDAYGMPTHAPEVTLLAYINYASQRFRNTAGDEIQSRAIIYVDGGPVTNELDQVTLPDGTRPKIQRLETWDDPQAGVIDHQKVFF